MDIFFPIAPDKRGDGLSGSVIRNVKAKSIDVIARELKDAAGKLRTDGDKNFKG